jgi:hypothetical protein
VQKIELVKLDFRKRLRAHRAKALKGFMVLRLVQRDQVWSNCGLQQEL